MKELFYVLLFLIAINAKGQTAYFGQVPPDNEPVKFASGIVSVSNRFDYGISFSPDGKEMAFGVLDPQNYYVGEIFYSKMEDENWSKPARMEVFTDSSVCLPFFAPDGKTMLFTQSKSRNKSEAEITDIYKLTKENGVWFNPTKLIEPVSSETREGSVCMTNNGTLYFSSNRNCIGEEYCLADIFSCRLEDGGYSKVKNVKAFNSESDEESVYVSPTEDFAIVRTYVGKKTGTDLFITYKKDNQWGELHRLNSRINSSGWEQRPFVSYDGKYLFFTRRTDFEDGRMESDIYWVSMNNILN